MTREEVEEKINSLGVEAMFADGFDEAIIGVCEQFTRVFVLYDYEKCVNDVLMKRDGMSREDAVDFMDFNVIGSWVGESTPAFLVFGGCDEV